MEKIAKWEYSVRLHEIQCRSVLGSHNGKWMEDVTHPQTRNLYSYLPYVRGDSAMPAMTGCEIGAFTSHLWVCPAAILNFVTERVYVQAGLSHIYFKCLMACIYMQLASFIWRNTPPYSYIGAHHGHITGIYNELGSGPHCIVEIFFLFFATRKLSPISPPALIWWK